MNYSFIIITPGRCGSEHLLETLNSYEDLLVAGEIFNRTNHQEGSFNYFIANNPINRILGYLFNREKLSRLPVNVPLKALISSFLSKNMPTKHKTGFKITLDQLFAYPYLLKRLPRYQIIYLDRKNRMEQVLSLLRARKTGIYQVRQAKKEGKNHHFDPKLVLDTMAQQQHWEQQLFNKLPMESIIRLSYESLFGSYSDSINLVRKFLNLPPNSPKKISGLVRTSEKTIDDWVTNLDEIKQLLLEKGMMESPTNHTSTS